MLFNSIFENSSTNVIDEFDAYLEECAFDDVDVVSEDYIAEALTEYNIDMYKLEAAMYITDVQLESALFEATEGEDSETVNAESEKAKESIIKRAKDALAKLWNNFQAFFTKMHMDLISFSNANRGFVKKHKDELLNIKANSIEIDIKYEFSTDIINDVVEELEKLSDSVINPDNIKKADFIPMIMDKLKNIIGIDGDVDVKELVSKFNEKTNVIKHKKTIKHKVSNQDIKAIISDIEESKNIIRYLGTLRDKIKKAFANANKVLADERKTLKKDDDTEGAKGMTTTIKNIQKFASSMTALASACIKSTASSFRAMSHMIKMIYSKIKTGYIDKTNDSKNTSKNKSAEIIDADFEEVNGSEETKKESLSLFDTIYGMI